MRARELGLQIGLLRSGEHDAITDVPGVLVGHTTLISGGGPLVVGTGPVRTGVTIVVPHEDNVFTEPVFAGCHRLNGNGELTGLEWVRESGMLGGVGRRHAVEGGQPLDEDPPGRGRRHVHGLDYRRRHAPARRRAP